MPEITFWVPEKVLPDSRTSRQELKQKSAPNIYIVLGDFEQKICVLEVMVSASEYRDAAEKEQFQ